MLRTHAKVDAIIFFILYITLVYFVNIPFVVVLFHMNLIICFNISWLLALGG